MLFNQKLQGSRGKNESSFVHAHQHWMNRFLSEWLGKYKSGGFWLRADQSRVEWHVRGDWGGIFGRPKHGLDHTSAWLSAQSNTKHPHWQSPFILSRHSLEAEERQTKLGSGQWEGSFTEQQRLCSCQQCFCLLFLASALLQPYSSPTARFCLLCSSFLAAALPVPPVIITPSSTTIPPIIFPLPLLLTNNPIFPDSCLGTWQV